MRILHGQEFKDIDDVTFDEIQQQYLSWVSVEKFLVLKKSEPGKLTQWHKVHAAKRGDAYYCKRVKDKFNSKVGHIPDYEYFSKRDRGLKKTDLIFVTLTYENKDVQNWIDNSKHYAQFANRMRSAYGKIEFIRVWESHADGYPHIHAVIRLHQNIFCRRINKVWRVIGKHYIRIKSFWNYGFSDVKALNGTAEISTYLSKYITKSWNGEDGKHVLTLAMLWYYQKRAFSISKRFYEDLKQPKVADLINPLHNSYDNSRWEYVGVMSEAEFNEMVAETRAIELWMFRKRGVEQGLDSFLYSSE
jgi:hypothetical protein